MAIVWPCLDGVEASAAAGRGVVVPRPDCPGCGAPMTFWSGYRRFLRPTGVFSGSCPPSQVRFVRGDPCLAPAFVLLGRADVVEVIGAALERAVAGIGLRPVAAVLGVPHTTTTARDSKSASCLAWAGVTGDPCVLPRYHQGDGYG